MVLGDTPPYRFIKAEMCLPSCSGKIAKDIALTVDDLLKHR